MSSGIQILSLLILVLTGWFSSFFRETGILKRKFFILLGLFFFSLFLPTISLNAQTELHVAAVLVMGITLYLFYRAPISSKIYVIICSSVIGMIFGIWTYLHSLFPGGLEELLQWLQLFFAVSSGFLLGNDWSERWNITFGILMIHHLFELYSFEDKGQQFLIGSPSFLEQVTMAIICFVLGHSILQKFRSKKINPVH